MILSKDNEQEQLTDKDEREPHYLTKSKNGLLVRVPESKLDDWKQAQNEKPQMTEEMKRRAKADLLRMLRGEK